MYQKKFHTHLRSAVMTDGRIEFVFTHHRAGDIGIHFVVSIILENTENKKIKNYVLTFFIISTSYFISYYEDSKQKLDYTYMGVSAAYLW